MFERLFSLCSEEKKDHLKRRKFLDDKKRGVFGEYLLKLALEDNKIVDREINYTKYGKPCLVKAKDFQFNISHSGDWVALAFNNKGLQVGVDIEKICEINYTGIAKRFFTEEENNFLNNCVPEEVLQNFYLLWTLKESYIKMVGKGLFIKLNSFSVVEKGTVKNQIKMDQTYRRGYFKSIDIFTDYKLSVCCEDKEIDEKYQFVKYDTAL